MKTVLAKIATRMTIMYIQPSSSLI